MPIQAPVTPLEEALDAAWTAGESLSWELPGDGHMQLDRPLPYLVVGFSGDADQEALRRLVASQPNYVFAADEDETRSAIQTFAEKAAEQFGCLLVLHLWIGELAGSNGQAGQRRPGFKLISPDEGPLGGTARELATALKTVVLQKETSEIEFICTDAPAAPGHDSLGLRPPHWLMGVEVAPAYRHQVSGQAFPVVYESMWRQVGQALKKGAFHFARTCSSWQPEHYLAVGPRQLGERAIEIDRELADIDASFDFLLQTTPINAQEAWQEFKEDNFQVPPVFHYRPLPIDPDRVKRRLFTLPVEKVEDPVLAQVFREKQEEIDRKLTMLREVDSRPFFLGSLQLYGEVQPPLLEMAQKILERLPERDTEKGSQTYVNAEQFASRARQEFAHYRRDYPDFPDEPAVRDDIPPSLMVSQGRLLIGQGVNIPEARVGALLEHEVGTHMLTYYNGCAQPLQLLHSGLAGYEALQEGIAVMAEHLAGGLSTPRLRVLAARVVAAHELIEEASFLEVFQLLTEEYNFQFSTAFSICMRIFRGGGFIKDVIYLRGLREVLEYLREGGNFGRLFVGKVAMRHLPVIEELQHRGMLRPPPLRPRMLARPNAAAHLERLKSGLTLFDLVNQPEL